jgi:UDP-N-acetylglucosamine acyltransferase
MGKFSNNQVSKNAFLVGDISMGIGNFVADGAQLIGPLQIGDNNFFGSYSIIGAPAQDNQISIHEHIARQSGHFSKTQSTIIGSNNVFREFVTVHSGLSGQTEILDSNYLMAYAHVAHDAFLGGNVKLANAVQLGGYSQILKGAYLGLSASTHQFSVIGGYCMIGMNSAINKSIPPGLTAAGIPAKVISANLKGLETIGFTDLTWIEPYKLNPLGSKVPALLEPFLKEYLMRVEKVKFLRKEVDLYRSESGNI